MVAAYGMTGDSLLLAGVIGYAAAAAGYLLLGALVVFYWESALARLTLSISAFTTAVWAGATAYNLYADGAVEWLSQLLEIARACGWLFLLLSLLYWVSPAERSTWAAASIALCVIVAAATLLFGNSPGIGDAGMDRLAVIGGHIVVALLGMVLTENLFRHSPPSRHWSIKYLCLGVGAMFAFDFFLYSDALLFRRLSADLFLARGSTTVLILPLLAAYAVRNRKGGPEIAVSRRLALHSATLAGAGLYLIAMAAAGYYVRHVGGTWSTFLQAIFFFGAVILLVAPMLSGSFRAYLRVLVEKSLFKYKYDYREEWLRFIQTISATDRSDDLRRRVIEAVCNIMDSPEGALWLQRQPGRFSLASSWNLSRWELTTADTNIDADGVLAVFLEQTQWIVNLEELAESPERYQGLATVPDWLRQATRAWLVVPLIQHERLFGLIVIGRSRVHRVLTWEDIDLLKIVGRQVASYLAELEASEALAEARQFVEFNKRFTFIAHDIKNLVSQLSLILANADKHRGNEAFQRDANETLRQSVDKLNRMLRQLHAQPAHSEAPKAIALAPLLQDVVARRRHIHPSVSLRLETDNVEVAVDESRLKMIVEHLVQNAVDAVGDVGHVQVRLIGAGKSAVVEIEDDGPGMDADFVREKLFRPFATTKGSGYGIGVYESREYATALGGRLDVVSQPGRGTIMRVTLPIAETA